MGWHRLRGRGRLFNAATEFVVRSRQRRITLRCGRCGSRNRRNNRRYFRSSRGSLRRNGFGIGRNWGLLRLRAADNRGLVRRRAANNCGPISLRSGLGCCGCRSRCRRYRNRCRGGRRCPLMRACRAGCVVGQTRTPANVPASTQDRSDRRGDDAEYSRQMARSRVSTLRSHCRRRQKSHSDHRFSTHLLPPAMAI
jgi:hypothetical protein